jgi:acetylornithine deacetylase/succinyl-diaminopimelate desuccinylase-like protein
MRNEDLLLDLIKINSESGNEKEIGDFIFNLLNEKGFKVEKQLVDEKSGSFNIFAFVGKPRVVFSNHLDTVPPQIEVKEVDGKIYGRGACDTKAQLAAALCAAFSAQEKGLADFGLAFTVQEELELQGAEKIVEILPDGVELIVVGEPTELELVRGHNGIICFEILAHGKTAHGSAPEKGINAIEMLMDDLAVIRKTDFGEDKVLGKNILNIAMISGGIADNVVPDEAKAVVSFRTVSDFEKVIEKLKSIVKGEVKITLKYNPFFNDQAEELAKKIGIKTKTVRYFTEASILRQKGNPVILGAGSIKEAHSATEFVSIAEYNKLIELYSEIIKQYN